ncbi:hypothetical protein QBC45DRAFT_416763 [Copromyces sp. CBS 386.78]|nr:hypothetical protein QBC45DRAFT_416763 [Copromyces sp. CBS 386.78]
MSGGCVVCSFFLLLPLRLPVSSFLSSSGAYHAYHTTLSMLPCHMPCYLPFNTPVDVYSRPQLLSLTGPTTGATPVQTESSFSRSRRHKPLTRHRRLPGVEYGPCWMAALADLVAGAI